jgi:hypothetical protein
MNTVDQVTAMASELEHLRAKDLASEEMIALLKTQNQEQAEEIAKMTALHAAEKQELKQRHDIAVRRETEITGILNLVANSIVNGLRKMNGDATPKDIPDKDLQQVDHPNLPRNDLIVPEPAKAKGQKAAELDIDDGVADLVRRLPQRLLLPNG